jgi:serine protease AprX
MRRRIKTALTCAVAMALPAFALTAGSASVASADTGPPVPMASSASVAVIVSFDGAGSADTAARSVTAAGGTVGRMLGIVQCFSATVPAHAVPALRSAPGIRAVAVDGGVKLQSNKTWDAGTESNSMYSVEQATGAVGVWKTRDAAGNLVTGKGIGVALIDSGVAPVSGLDDSRILNGPDLSFESQNATARNVDTFGHGTHMASIIAGLTDEKLDSAKQYAGMAPGANLISLKVATADGATDVSQVIAAIDWVVTHKNDPGMNIRVLNLSFGTLSTQDPRIDPLSMAVESAWRKGIVVVVSVGNEGAAGTSVDMPAANPYVLSVGAADWMGTADPLDDTLASFSSVGNLTRHADLVAPGKSIFGLRDPGSFVDQNFPGGLVPGDTTGRFFRGSGTSQAAAVVSGAVALLLQKRPTLTPDQVKAILMGTATPMPKALISYSKGTGQLNVAAAMLAPAPLPAQTWTPATGTGSLEAARGGSHVADPDTGTELTGEKDIFGKAWNPTVWATQSKTGTAWTGGTWNGSVWTGSALIGSTWSSVTWTGGDWTSRTWSSRTWSGAVWDGRTWSGRTWSSRTWSGRTWSGSNWSSAIWE